MKDILIKSLLRLLLLAMLSMPLMANEQSHGYTMAIFPFVEKGADIEDYGQRISNELSANLYDAADIELMDNEAISRRMGNIILDNANMIDLPRANEIGQLTGAEVVVTGTILVSGDSIIIVSRIISTQTNRIFMDTIRGNRADADALMGSMASRLAEVIKLHGFKLFS